MRIGELARRSGVTASAVRFYERAGLLPEISRTTGGYREYAEEETLRRLALIRRAKDVGFSLREIRALIAEPGLRRTRERDALQANIDRKRAEVRAKTAALQAMERELL